MLVSGETISVPAVAGGPTVTVPLTFLPDTYDPDSYQSKGYGTELAALTLPSAYFVDPLGNIALDTDVVGGVAIYTNPQKIVYRLNPKATWSDGVPLDCQDFYLAWLSNVSRAMDPSDSTSPAFNLYSDSLYDQADAPTCSDGGRTVTVAFHTSTASWPDLFQGMLPAHIAARDAGIADVTSIGKKATSGAVLKLSKAYNRDFGALSTAKAVSAGPYVVRSASTSDIALTRNPKWWGNPAGPRGVRLVAAPDSTAAIQQMRNGEADAAGLSIQDPAVGRQADAVTGLLRTNQTLPVSEHIEFNLRKKLFTGAAGNALRQAVFSCVDRSAIVSTVAKSLNPKADELGNMLVEPWNPAYADHYTAYRTADVAKARLLMQQAGWKLGKDGVFARGGTRAQFTLSYLDNPSRAEIAAMVQQQCKRAGIVIKTDTFDASALYGSKFQAALFAWSAPVMPVDYGYNYASDSDGNTSGYADPDVDKLINNMAADIKPTDETGPLNQIDKIIAGAHVVLPLYDWTSINLQQHRVRTTVTDDYFWGGLVWDVYAWSVTG